MSIHEHEQVAMLDFFFMNGMVCGGYAAAVDGSGSGDGRWERNATLTTRQAEAEGGDKDDLAAERACGGEVERR